MNLINKLSVLIGNDMPANSLRGEPGYDEAKSAQLNLAPQQIDIYVPPCCN